MIDVQFLVSKHISRLSSGIFRLFSFGGGADFFTHLRVCFDVFEVVVVHYAELSIAEGRRHGHRDLGFGFDELGLHLHDFRLHFLFGGECHGAAFFGLGLSNLLVGFGTVGFEDGTDVLAHIHVSDVDGENFECCTSVKAGGEHLLGNHVRVFENFLVAHCRTDGRDDAFANAGDDSFFAGTADELLDAGAHGDTRDGVELDTVEGHCGNLRGRDDFRVHGHLHGFEHVTARKVDCGGFFKVELDVSLVCCDERLDDAEHVTAGEVVCFEQVRIDREACLAAEDSRFDDDLRRHFSKTHTDELENAHVCLGEQCLKPKAKEFADKGEDDDDDDGSNDYAYGKKSIH